MDLFGTIDLTALGQIVRSHPELVRNVQKKDGTNHQYLRINVSERKQPSPSGHTHYVKAHVKSDQQRQDLNYYIADLKPSQYQQQAAPQAAPAYNTPAPAPAAPTAQPTPDDLPF